jgi:steroid delta-isomerase-like uncharacterized protein
MSTDDNKKAVRRYLEQGWGAGDLSTLESMLAPDYRLVVLQFDTSGDHGTSGAGGRRPASDREAVLHGLQMYRKAFPDLRLNVESLVAEDNTVVAQWKATGTHSGEVRGVAPTGKRVIYAGITIYQLEGGKIRQESYFGDRLGLWQQLGTVPETRELVEESGEEAK